MKKLSLLLLILLLNPLYSATSNDWFSYAQNDLRAAEILTDMKEPLLGTALYHIEQAVEKALKAYLVAHSISFALTHDLKPLLKSCAAYDTYFATFSEDVATINPFSTKSRYPNKSYKEPALTFVKQLTRKAATLLAYVKSHL